MNRAATKQFLVRFTYGELTSAKRREAESTVEAEGRNDAADIIYGRWNNVRIRTIVEIASNKLPHKV